MKRLYIRPGKEFTHCPECGAERISFERHDNGRERWQIYAFLCGDGPLEFGRFTCVDGDRSDRFEVRWDCWCPATPPPPVSELKEF